MNALKKLSKEYNDLKYKALCELGLTVGLADESNMFIWKFTLVGLKDTSYRGGMFQLKIYFPYNCPRCGPRICFLTPIYHINVSVSPQRKRYVGFSKTSNWNPESTVREILISLYSIFYLANPKSSNIFGNEYKKNRDLYERKVKYFTKKYARSLQGKYSDKDWDFSVSEYELKGIKNIKNEIICENKNCEINLQKEKEDKVCPFEVYFDNGKKLDKIIFNDNNSIKDAIDKCRIKLGVNFPELIIYKGKNIKGNWFTLNQTLKQSNYSKSIILYIIKDVYFAL